MSIFLSCDSAPNPRPIYPVKELPGIPRVGKKAQKSVLPRKKKGSQVIIIIVGWSLHTDLETETEKEPKVVFEIDGRRETFRSQGQMKV